MIPKYDDFSDMTLNNDIRGDGCAATSVHSDLSKQSGRWCNRTTCFLMNELSYPVIAVALWEAEDETIKHHYARLSYSPLSLDYI